MKNFKKIITIILSIAFIFASFTPLSFADVNNEGSDVAAKTYVTKSVSKSRYGFTASNYYNYVHLNIRENTFGRSENIDALYIYRSRTKNGNYKLIEVINPRYDFLEYDDYDVHPGRTYYYKVKIVPYNGNSRFSSPIVITRPMAKPNLKLTIMSTSSIKLNWSKTYGADGYRIYRYYPSTGRYKLVKTIKNQNTTTWTNNKLKKGNKYTYKVRAYRYGRKGLIYSKFSNSKAARPCNNVYINHPSYEFDDYGEVHLRLKSVSYNSNGKLKVNCVALNDRVFFADYFDWVRISIYVNNKCIGSQKFYNKSINLYPYDYRTLTFTLDKGTYKKINLRNVDDVYLDYNYYYYYSY